MIRLRIRTIIPGSILVEITSPEPEGTLNAILQEDIPVAGVMQKNALAFRFSVRRQDLKRLEALVQRIGCKLEVIRRQGVYWKLKALQKRPVLVWMVVVLAAVSIFLPTRILFVRVEGNQNLPSRKILSAAEISGIRFGASRKKVRREKMKNALLSQLPQLQWAGVNTSGCTAVISVRERTEEQKQRSIAFSNLVATQDGYILSQTILGGTPMFTPGESVIKGQVLVSGYTDCGICLRAGRAEGEILAQTVREITAVTPSERQSIREITDKKYKISLLIRKKRINLWKDSGIWDATCDRMYEEYYITLPGGFQLPFGWCVERYASRELTELTLAYGSLEKLLSGSAEAYLKNQMLSGTIRKSGLTYEEREGFLQMTGEFDCVEMIGFMQRMEIGE